MSGEPESERASSQLSTSLQRGRGFRTPGRRRGALHLGLSLLVFAATWYLYRESPVVVSSDATYTLLASSSLLSGDGLALDAHLQPRPLDRERFPGLARRAGADSLPYQLRQGRDHVLPWYPPGTAVLSAPLLLVMKPFGYGVLDAQGRYDFRAEIRAMRHIATFLTALFVLLVFLLAAELLPPWWAAGVAALVAVATPAWSSLSRSLWSHDWFVVLVIAAVWLLVRATLRGAAPNGVLLATLLTWAFFVRPTAASALLAVGVFLLMRWRQTAWRYAAVASLWGLAFVAWSWRVYGELLPSYYTLAWTGERRCGAGVADGLAGVLISPSRGLLIFCPWIVLVAWVLLRYRRQLRSPALFHMAWPVCIAQIWMVGSSPQWWGGSSYGPRLMSDVLPWLVLLSILALDAWRSGRERGIWRRRRVEAVVGALLLLLSIGLHAPGALSEKTHIWNHGSRCDRAVRVWDWSDPQFLSWRRTAAIGGGSG